MNPYLNNYQFVSYEKTPNDVNQIGIITILAYGDIGMRYKHVQKKDGSGSFLSPASITQTQDNQQKIYHAGLFIDSNSKKTILENWMYKCIGEASKAAQPMASPSAFTQPIQGYAQPELIPEGQVPF